MARSAGQAALPQPRFGIGGTAAAPRVAGLRALLFQRRSVIWNELGYALSARRLARIPPLEQPGRQRNQFSGAHRMDRVTPQHLTNKLILPPPRDEDAVVITATAWRRMVRRLEESASGDDIFGNLGWTLVGVAFTCVAAAITSSATIRLAFVMLAAATAGMAGLSLFYSRREKARGRELVSLVVEEMREFIVEPKDPDTPQERLRYRAVGYLSNLVERAIRKRNILPEEEWDWELLPGPQTIQLKARRKSDGAPFHPIVNVAPDWEQGTSWRYATTIADQLQPTPRIT
jgi:hypothetical protein